MDEMKEKSPYEFMFYLTLSDFNCLRYANSMGTQNTSIKSLSLTLIMSDQAKDADSQQTTDNTPDGAKIIYLSSSELNPMELLEQGIKAIPDASVNDEFKGFCPPDVTHKEVKTWYEDTAAATSKTKAMALESLRKEHTDKWLGGIWETEEITHLMAGSNGLLLRDQFTRYTFELKAEQNGKSASVYRIGRDLGSFDIHKECDKALKNLERKTPKQIPKDGKYRVVFGPEAVSEICFFISLLGFGGRGDKQGSNFTSGKIGEKLFENDLIHLSDNCYNPLTLTCKHDNFGYPRKPLTLLNKGKICEIAHTQFTAKTLEENTGHGGSGAAMLMELKEGSSTIDELYTEKEKTVLISRFHYPTIADRSKPEIKGSTKDGTYLYISDRNTTEPTIKDAGTLEFFFNPVRLLENTTALSKDRFVVPQGSLSMSMVGANIVPYIAVDDVTIKDGKLYLL